MVIQSVPLVSRWGTVRALQWRGMAGVDSFLRRGVSGRERVAYMKPPLGGWLWFHECHLGGVLSRMTELITLVESNPKNCYVITLSLWPCQPHGEPLCFTKRV